MCCPVNIYDCLSCVFVNCLVKQFAICLGVVVILLLMLWKCLVWVEVLCLIDRVSSSKECACCVCESSVHISGPFIGFVYVLYVGSYLLL